VLKRLFDETPISGVAKNQKTADDIFYEYLVYVKDLCNKNYFILCLKFLILFRECMNNSRQKEVEKLNDVQHNGDITTTDNHTNETNGQAKREYSTIKNCETAPDLCNEFITDFLENNDYFGIEGVEDRNEFIDLVQHLCFWMHRNEYTQSRLTLMS